MQERLGAGEVTVINIQVASLLVFVRTSLKVLEFVIAYKLYIRIKMRGVVVEKQV